MKKLIKIFNEVMLLFSVYIKSLATTISDGIWILVGLVILNTYIKNKVIFEPIFFVILIFGIYVFEVIKNFKTLKKLEERK